MGWMTRRTRRLLAVAAVTATAGYGVICAAVYSAQELMIFPARTLPQAFHFEFPWPFEEQVVADAGASPLHGLLFRAAGSRGVVYYLHGNGGSLQEHGGAAGRFLERGFDTFAIDYPGYGKSGGRITSQADVEQAVERGYQYLRRRYEEGRIVVVGYSLGTALAAYVASLHHPRRLMLIAPFFSMDDMARQRYPFLPAVLLKYPLPTNEWLPRCRMPITLVHGTADRDVPFASSERLLRLVDDGRARLVRLDGATHLNWGRHPLYLAALDDLLE